jgi:phosphoglucomutase
MERELKEKIDRYLNDEDNLQFKKEIEELMAQNNTAELNDRFYRDLEFGTAGLRGIIAGGFNRMNGVVIRRTTAGLAAWLNKNFKNPAVVIAYDCRHYSREFAETTASVLAGAGIKVYLFEAMRPTPALAYAVVHYKAAAGIMITASHNPPAYNGYKVFQSDGSQIVSPADKEILEAIEQSEAVRPGSFQAFVRSAAIELIGADFDEIYFEMALKTVREDIFKKAGNIHIVYTPLHGTGAPYIEPLFERLGVPFTTVNAQRAGNGDFPTVSYPNPEEPAGLKMALEEALALKADLVLANDPDSDRLAVAYADNEGTFTVLNGHQMGALFAHYLLGRAKREKIDLAKAYIVKSIVTSELESRVAESFGVKCFNVLTGFKWIADKIRLEEKAGNIFIFGNEEAIGYLPETAIRDKDGITAALVAAEMAIYYKAHGKTLGNVLEDLYRQFGYYEDTQISKTYEGEQGVQIIKNLMLKLREAPPKTIGTKKIEEIYDFESLTVRDAEGRMIRRLDYAKSNVLQFYCDDGSRLSVRPSGTEPKIKFYISSVVSNFTDKQTASAFESDVEALITTLTR